MMDFSGAVDSSDFDDNTILLEREDNEYVYLSGFGIFKLKTDDKNIDCISLIGNNMCPYTIAIREIYTYFISSHYKFIENDKIEEGTFSNATNSSLDPFNYHLGKCGVDFFKTLEHTQIHTCWPGFEEGEEDEDVVFQTLERSQIPTFLPTC